MLLKDYNKLKYNQKTIHISPIHFIKHLICINIINKTYLMVNIIQ